MNQSGVLDTTDMVVHKEKKELRQMLLERLLRLTQEEIKRRSKHVQDRLSNLPIYKKAKFVMAFYPLKGEVDILGLIRKEIGHKRFCFPVMDVAKKSLRIFEVVRLDDDFVPGPFGVWEPNTEKTNEVDSASIDITLVPGLAFDHAKNRLGRGKGFYDRFLKKAAPDNKKIGVAFDFQVLQNLPIHLSHDQKVDYVVSEKIVM